MLPSLLRASLRLWQARRALLGGAPERALGLLSDPALALSRRADWLRGRTLDQLCRQAGERARAGRASSARRILNMVDAEDHERAQRERARLEGAPPPGEADRATRRALRELLDELRAAAPGAPAGPPTPAPPARSEPGPAAPAAERPALPLRLSIDDAGELVLLRARPLVLGNLRARRAELLFLADLEPEHARLVPEQSLHEGPGWRIEPLAGEVRVDDERLAAPRRLTDGARVRLAHNLGFRFRFPDAASASAALELEGGVECLGASRVLLVVEGAAGIARVGRSRSCHLVAPSFEQELSLRLEGDALVLASAAGLRAAGAPAAERRAELALGLPLERALALELGERRRDAPPTGLYLRAPEGPGAGGKEASRA